MLSKQCCIMLSIFSWYRCLFWQTIIVEKVYTVQSGRRRRSRSYWCGLGCNHSRSWYCCSGSHLGWRTRSHEVNVFTKQSAKSHVCSRSISPTSLPSKCRRANLHIIRILRINRQLPGGRSSIWSIVNLWSETWSTTYIALMRYCKPLRVRRRRIWCSRLGTGTWTRRRWGDAGTGMRWETGPQHTAHVILQIQRVGMLFSTRISATGTQTDWSLIRKGSRRNNSGKTRVLLCEEIFSCGRKGSWTGLNQWNFESL